MPQPPEPREMALLCADLADEKKADEIIILEVRDLLVITSYFVIASGDSRKQLQAIAESIHETLKPLGAKRYGREGVEEGKWILLDYGDVVVQLFDRDTRGYYNLEMIWGDAPRVQWTPKHGKPAGPRVRAPAPEPEPEHEPVHETAEASGGAQRAPKRPARAYAEEE